MRPGSESSPKVCWLPRPAHLFFHFLALAALLLLLLPQASLARELHVDAAAPQDNAACTAEAPCPTINAALNLAEPGDTVVVAAGVYREAIAFPRDGKADAPITLTAAPGARVEVKGSEVVPNLTDQGKGIWMSAGWPVNSQQIFVDGVSLAQIGRTCPFHEQLNQGKPFLPVRGSGRQDLTPGTFFYDQAGKALYISPPQGSDLSRSLVEASVRPFTILPATRNFITIRGISFAHGNISAHGIYGSMANAWGRGWLISGCDFDQSDFSGLAVLGEDHLIEDCRFRENGDLGLTILGTDEAHDWKPVKNRPPQNIVVRDCLFSDNNTRGFDPSWQAGGVKASTSITGARFSGLVLTNNHGPGLWLDVLADDVVVEGCLARGNSVGLASEISDNVIFRNNILIGNDYGLLIAASSHVAVINNTFHANKTALLAHGLPRADHPRLSQIEILNNLFSDNATDMVVLVNKKMGAFENTSDYNVFANSSASPAAVWTNDASLGPLAGDLERIREKTGQESHSKAVPRLFPGAIGKAAELAPKAGGPLVDAGRGDPRAGEIDFAGNPRIVDGGSGSAVPDVGALEFQGSGRIPARNGQE